MLNFFIGIKFYMVIIIALLGVFFYFQSEQISTQKKLIIELQQDKEAFQDVFNDLEEQNAKINTTYRLLEQDYKKIDDTYKTYSAGLNEEFKKHAWDDEKMPTDLYCRIECLQQEHNPTCDCSKYTAHDVSTDVQSSRVKRR